MYKHFTNYRTLALRICDTRTRTSKLCKSSFATPLLVDEDSPNESKSNGKPLPRLNTSVRTRSERNTRAINIPFPNMKGTLAEQRLLNFQARTYHSTSQNQVVFLGAVVLLGGVGYIVYRKYRGQPLMPQDALKAQEAYRKQVRQRQGLRGPKKSEQPTKNNNHSETNDS